MRLHSNDEIETMTRERILELLNMVDGSEHTDYSTDELREISSFIMGTQVCYVRIVAKMGRVVVFKVCD